LVTEETLFERGILILEIKHFIGEKFLPMRALGVMKNIFVLFRVFVISLELPFSL